MNFHDSERMAGLLEEAGYEPTDDDVDADVIVVNTCSVRERAEEKLFSRLGRLALLEGQHKRRPVVVVAGCVAQQEGVGLLQRAPVVDVVVGTQAVRRLPILIGEAASDWQPRIDINPYEDVSFPLGVARRGDPVKAYVTIIEGCNDFCSFCVVPYTAGPGADASVDRDSRRKCGRRPGRGIRRSICSGKSSITIGLRMIQGVTLRDCSSSCTRWTASSGSGLPVHTLAT